jgi:hypothetical protein
MTLERFVILASRLSVASVLFVAFALSAIAQKNPIVSLTANGRLAYETDTQGNRVPDFSACGYAGADRPIPDAPVRVVVAPIKGDSTIRIQRAIDYVAGLAADSNGLRGAVLLMKGRHEVAGGLRITNSGVVLRGQGPGENGTALIATGLDRRTLIRVIGESNLAIRSNAAWQITDEYVPVGATSFHLKDATAFRPGTPLRLIRPSTKEWIDRLSAAEFGGGIGGGWKPGTRDIVWDRTVTSVERDLITVDAPITTAIEASLGTGRIEQYDWPGRINDVGIENLHLESTFDTANPKDENHSWCAITMENAADAWVRQVTFKHFAGSAVAIYETCKRVTVEDCLSLAPVSEEGGYRRHTFFTMGQQTLFLRCYAEQGRHDFSVGHCAAGPNAFVQCEARNALEDSGAIESWASGILFDNVVIDGNALALGFRPGNNAATGWSAANCVLWQCSASVIRCWNPPTAQNWAFGCWAGFEGNGVWRSANDFVSPDSLYAGQLRDRLGPDAAARLKLMPRPHEESSNPPVDKAQELAAASHQPAPQLKGYIAAAGKRGPIPSEPGNAKRVDKIQSPKSEVRSPKSTLVVTNGWLTINGKLLIGGTANVPWWRGNIRPEEASVFGPAVTRFVPGRVGRGFTDDLGEVADSLIANGRVALDHNYGLWYDRRRDDHERVRRMNGDVIPPFYEQPFARSGQGVAWDGLSKYDLTRFNPWYWLRLQEFAGVCEQRGLVLFHQNYFQHNILEAGAHWADCPWRSANNVNNTGFPEPPPYAGDKRIFQAELFYDVTHPVRRKLHASYIRQCLDNFKTNANVIQFTSAEYTGPLHFVQFWIDTIAEWESAIGNRQSAIRRLLIALSATKDVQDAILADPKRSAAVDVIDFRYWWRTDRGEFAPPGGKNLAPRQFERQWRGGRPNDQNLAGMASEYRSKFPDKPVICDFDSADWAWVCGGGSMPRLPETADPKLLAAIPTMKPWTAATSSGRWVLHEPDQQFLVYIGTQGPGELDLTQEKSTLAVRTVDVATGQVTALPDRVPAGTKLDLRKFLKSGPTVLWLVKE